MSLCCAAARARRREAGYLRSIGVGRGGIFALSLTESLIPSAVGGLIGGALGVSMTVFLREMLRAASIIPYVSWDMSGMSGRMALSVLAAVLVSLAAALIPTWRSAAMEPHLALSRGGL